MCTLNFAAGASGCGKESPALIHLVDDLKAHFSGYSRRDADHRRRPSSSMGMTRLRELHSISNPLAGDALSLPVRTGKARVIGIEPPPPHFTKKPRPAGEPMIQSASSRTESA